MCLGETATGKGRGQEVRVDSTAFGTADFSGVFKEGRNGRPHTRMQTCKLSSRQHLLFIFLLTVHQNTVRNLTR